MVSGINNYNQPSAGDVTALLRGSSKDSGASQTNKDPSTPTTNDSPDRGPAVAITISAIADLVTRQKALDALGAQPDNVANALSDQLQSSANALNTLDQASKNTAADRKKEAEQKLEQAQKKLQLLQILGGDPAKMAKEAKEIGKDIKDAASEYTKAMKDAAAGGNAVAAASQTVSREIGTADVAGVSSDGSPAPVGDASLPATKALATGSANPAKAGASADATTAEATGNRDGAKATGVAEAQPPAQSAADKAAAAATKYRLGQHDRDVVESFKKAANQVKQVIQDAAQKQKSKNSLDPGVTGTAQVSKEMDKAVQELSDTVRIEQSGGDISDTRGSAFAAPVFPALDILA